MRVSQTKVHFGSNKMEHNYEKSETLDALLTKIDVPKIMNRIMSTKRFADASVIFIVTSDDEEDPGSSNVDLSTSIQSSECYVPVKSIRQVDPDSALKHTSYTRRNEQIGGKRKKFYLQEIASYDTETMFQSDSLEVLRRIKRSFGHPNEIAQMRVNAVQGVGPKTVADEVKVTTNRSVKVQKPSIESMRHEGGITPEKLADEVKVTTNRSVKVQKPSIESMRHEGGITPEKLADEVKVTTNRSVKVQKPSIESMRHEGGITPENLADNGWLLKSPANDPNEPKDLKSPNSNNLKLANIEKMQKWEPKGQPMPGLQPQNQQLVKLTEEVLPVPQKLASAKIVKQKEQGVCPCKTYKLMSPEEPGKLAEVKLVPQKELLMSPKQLESSNDLEGQKSSNRASRLFTKIKKSIFKKNESIKNHIGQQAPRTLKNKDLQSPKAGNKMNESLKNQIGQQAPRTLKNKDLQSPKAGNKLNESLKNQIGQQAPSTLKDLQSPKTGKQKEGKVTCECEEKGKQQDGNTKCDCEEKSKQKEGDIQCECKEDKPMSPKALTTPVTRHPPLLPPVLLGPVETTPEGKFYEVIGPSCKWVDKAEIKSLRSQLTRSTSGFTVSKRRKIVQSQSEDCIELDFGDAIRYFASMNPERFQQLMQEELKDQLNEQKKYEGKEGKKLKKKMEKEIKKLEKAQRKAEKKGKINMTTTADSPETFESSDESEDKYPKGFKLSIGVKDYKSKALAGWDCTDILNV